MKNLMKNSLILVAALILVFNISHPNLTEAASKPSLNSLVKEYEKATDKLFYWSALNDGFSKASLVQDVASMALTEYQSLTLPGKRQYKAIDFIGDVNTVVKVALQTGSKRVTLPMKVAVKAKYYSASADLKNAEKRLKKYYPAESKCVLSPSSCKGGSGGGGATRSW
ncbi:hypothetical protein ABIC37_002894 [Priestia megaterium]|uniref:hypothetical protein n=1 Tax=Priestia TaxID=2800373 RepID=UPI0005E33B0B|nr:hypothetical protein [Priestia megaterium]KRD99293.1 hypothetical protein ASE46_13485 [Bacillus sp. Root239]MCM3542439.1 hypothetical protein [Priestia megaterium]MED3879676.1 hypothetical protein [Priestia megaterium]CJF76673.1 Uncharacterised protein [Streptococcus pneumoniae]